MGWNPFKSEEVTRVATSVSRAISDDLIPDSVKAGLIKSVLQDGGSVSDYVMDELALGIGTKAERLYNYGKTKYVHGLPSGQIYSSTQGRSQVEEVIEQQIEHQQVLMEYSHYGEANSLHIGWTKLIANHGYNPATNQLGVLSAQKGKAVYLKDMVVVVPESQVTSIDNGRLVQWGSPANAGYTPERAAANGLFDYVGATPVHTTSTGSDVYLEVTAEWATGIVASPYATQTFTIDLSGYDLTANYFHAKYRVNSVTKYWMYKFGSGTYATLDNVYVDGPAVNGTYFPFTYFRYGKHSTNSDTLSQSYKTSKSMVKKLGMDFDLVADAINANPNIGDVESAMLTFSVPSVSSNPQENRYLFDYFDAQHAAMDGTTLFAETAVLNTLMGLFGFGSWSDTANTTVIKDSQFKMTLGNNGIYKRAVAGMIGAINSYTSSYETVNVEQQVVNFESGQMNTEFIPTSVHRYRHQITDGLYEEVLVTGLRMTYYVYGNYTTAGDGTSDILLIPIDKSITETYAIKDREILYARSMHFVFNSRTVTEVKWYQQEWFQVVLIVVAVVLTILDMGSDGGSWIATALGVTGTTAIVVTVVFQLIIGLLMPHVFRLFVKAFGQEAAEIFAIAAIIYGAYNVATTGMAALPTAADMLMMSTGLEKAVIESKFVDLQTEYGQFQDYAKQQQAELTKASELLGKQELLNPFVIFGEKPEDFYNRTIHTGNIGTLGINAVSSYVDIALTLPKIYDTLGEPQYGNET